MTLAELLLREMRAALASAAAFERAGDTVNAGVCGRHAVCALRAAIKLEAKCQN